MKRKQRFCENVPKGTLQLTPDMLVNAYEYLRITLPFRRMNLPEGDQLLFRVIGAKDRLGYFRGRYRRGKREDFNEIAISANEVSSTELLMATMAHEMIHLYQHESGTCPRGFHNKKFRQIAARVCRLHGFALEDF